jgi:hypothetical protein
MEFLDNVMIVMDLLQKNACIQYFAYNLSVKAVVHGSGRPGN